MLDLALALTLVLPTPTLALAQAATPRAARAREQDPTVLEAPIEEVTVFPGQALVLRRAELETAGGRFIVRGLPWSMDPSSVRASCEGAVVVGIETRDRNLPAVPDARMRELQAEQRRLERAIQELESQVGVLVRIEKHLRDLLDMEADEHKSDVREGRGTAEVWAANLKFLGESLQSNADERRELGWQIEELRVQLSDVQMELGRNHGRGTLAREVIVELAGRTGRGAVKLDLEYLVSNAGWSPLYDLRAASDAGSVELAYRAEVFQQSGEDWDDVELLLSTARPNLGAQGPDPRPIWLWLIDPNAPKRKAPEMERLQALGYGADLDDGDSKYLAEEDAGRAGAPAPSLAAAVESQGLSVRFRLATRETIESRGQPTNVLVGQASFDVAPEYYATPALDTNVWLRGVATNTSEWVMLPGRASVYFGADFIGHAHLDLVQPGQEFDLHLGADPALTLERTQTDDLTKKPGVFGSRMRRQEGWRIALANNGAAVALADGSAKVIVREVLPRPKDSRIEVELSKANPKPSDGDRWAQDRKDEGILTWVLNVPNGGESQIVYETEVSYPDGMTVRR